MSAVIHGMNMRAAALESAAALLNRRGELYGNSIFTDLRAVTENLKKNPSGQYVSVYDNPSDMKNPEFAEAVEKTWNARQRFLEAAAAHNVRVPANLAVDIPNPFGTARAVGSKAQVQAVKDVLGQKGLPDTMDSGPMGNILGMAGIKAPPKQTGVARRKTRRRRKTTRKSRK